VMVSVSPQMASTTSSASPGSRWERQYQCMPCCLPPSTIDWRSRYGRGRRLSATGRPMRRRGATARRPSAGSPAHTGTSPRTGLPYCSGGTSGPGGASRAKKAMPSSSGAWGAKSRRKRSTSGASARGQKIGPPRTIGPTACSRYSKAVTTPKFPPPPRNPQNSSGSASASTRSRSPSAVTRFTASRLSTVSPCLRIRWPSPPPKVSPPIPVCLTIPDGTASPNRWVARSSSPSRTPPAARAVRAAGSTRTAFLSDRSIISPPSTTPCPATAWPPPRTEIARSCSRAKRTAWTTSSAPAQRAIRAGRRSMAPFQTRRASS
jgi:hypothetical protein